jgi:hypothetical protein
MNKVTQLHENVPDELRAIANWIERGERPGKTCTLVLDSFEIISVGHGRIHPDQAAREAVFDLNVALHKLMHPVCEE